METANQQIMAGAYGTAAQCYLKILELSDNPENRMELAEIYFLAEEHDLFLKVMEALLELYPEYIQCYERMAEYYFNQSDYKLCTSTIKRAKEVGLVSEKMNELFYQSAYGYQLEPHSFQQAGIFVNGIAFVQEEGLYHYIKTNLKEKHAVRVDEAGQYLGKTAAVCIGGEFFYIDEAGRKYLEPSIDCIFAHSFSEGFSVVETEDGVGFLDAYGKLRWSGFSQATSFSGGVAAVQIDGQWRTMDRSGKYTSKRSYERIAVGPDHQCSTNGRIFAGGEGQLFLYSTDGKQLSDLCFQEARPFLDQGPAAVKIDGQWGFVNVDGNLVLNPLFEEAYSFLNGLAAVRVDGNWGYIDRKGIFVIAAQFEEAKPFTDSGLAPVKLDGAWHYIRLDHLEGLDESIHD